LEVARVAVDTDSVKPHGDSMNAGVVTGFRSGWTVLWKTALFFVVWGLLLFPFVAPMGPILAEWEKTFPLMARWYGEIVGATTMVVATWLMMRFIDHRPFLAAAFAPVHLARDAPAGLGVGSLWLLVSVGIAWAAGWASPQAPVGFSWTVLLGAAVALFFNVLTQQLLLCGYIFQTIRSQAGLGVTVVVSALLFAGYHAGVFKGAWLPAVNVFAAGVLFSLAYGLTGNLWFPISIHFAWNLLLGPVLGATVSGSSQLGNGWRLLVVSGPELLTGGGFGLEGGLVVTLTTVMGIVALALVQRGRPREVGLLAPQVGPR